MDDIACDLFERVNVLEGTVNSLQNQIVVLEASIEALMATDSNILSFCSNQSRMITTVEQEISRLKQHI